MRTTLNLDDDVLRTVKFIAKFNKMQVGQVLSQLARQSLQSKKTSFTRNGFVLMPSKGSGQPVTLELINRLRDED